MFYIKTVKLEFGRHFSTYFIIFNWSKVYLPNKIRQIPPNGRLFCLTSHKRSWIWYNCLAFIIENSSMIHTSIFLKLSLNRSLFWSESWIRFIPNRLKAVWIVDPWILAAAIPVGAALRIRAAYRCGKSYTGIYRYFITIPVFFTGIPDNWHFCYKWLIWDHQKRKAYKNIASARQNIFPIESIKFRWRC